MMNKLVGVDVSFYQDDNETPKQIDFVKMAKSAGFVIIRAGQRNWIDPDFAYNWQKAKEAGIPRGSYWFYDSREAPEKQADIWYGLFGGDFGELPLWADYEETYGGAYRGITHFKKFVERIYMLTGKTIGVYTGYYYWKDNGGYWEYFRNLPLWIANYGVTTPSVPAPWSDWLFWQYTDNGDGKLYGCESNNVDMNYFNGTKDEFDAMFGGTTPIPPVEDEVTYPYNGVEHLKLKRFGTDVNLLRIDLGNRRFRISDARATVSSAAKNSGAQIVTNGDGWPPTGDTGHPISICVSEGKITQAKRKDWNPYMTVSKDNQIAFGEAEYASVSMWNAISFDRYTVLNGAFDERVSDKKTKNARTAAGKTADGKLLLMVADGDDTKGIGLSFPEEAAVLIEFGCVTGGNLDGGGSTTMWVKDKIVNHPNDDDLFGIPTERSVVNHVMIFMDDGGEIPPEGENMKYEVINPVKCRKTPSMYEVNTLQVNSGGYSFEGIAERTVVEVIPAGSGTKVSVDWVQMGTDFNNYWIPKSYKGVTYLLPITEPLPDEKELIQIRKSDDGGATWTPWVEYKEI